MLHVRADTDNDRVDRLARAFGSNVIISSEGPSGTLRREATERGVPTITIEMGKAHEFQRDFIDRGLDGVKSVFSEFGLRTTSAVKWPGWRTLVDGSDEKTWLRADSGGMVEMHFSRGSFVKEGETICTIANPFETTATEVKAPFTGLLVGILQNPLVFPGNPICHLVELDQGTQRVVETEQRA
jgi:predicted deacylase